MFLFLHLITQVIILLQHMIHVSHRVLIMDVFLSICRSMLSPSLWCLACVQFSSLLHPFCKDGLQPLQTSQVCTGFSRSLLPHELYLIIITVVSPFRLLYLVNYTDSIFLIAEAEDWTAMKERDTEADPLNAPWFELIKVSSQISSGNLSENVYLLP